MNALQLWQYRAVMRRSNMGLMPFRRRSLGRLGALGGLDPATIAQYASNAGFSGADLYTAVAIALAESSGNPNAYNPETAAGAPTGKGSYGLWQIYLNMHPEFAGANLYDPQTNANAAYSIYAARGNSFGAWSTYNSLAFQKYMPTVTAAPAALPTPTPAPASTDSNAITIDASTGQPVDSSVDVSQLFAVNGSTAAPATSSGSDNALLYGGAALAALLLVSLRD